MVFMVVVVIKKLLLIILILFLFNNIVSGLVTFYPNVVLYNGDLVVGFSNPDGINVTYFEMGSDYVLLDDYNLSLSFTGSLMVNFSMYTNLSSLDRINNTLLRFNATHTSGSVVFNFTNNNHVGNLVYYYYKDSVLIDNFESDSFEFSHSSWSTHDFMITGIITPDPPYNGDSSIDTGTNTANLTWVTGNYSDRNVVVRSTTSYPSSPTGGTVVQNSSSEYYNFSISGTYYYSIWSYNISFHTFSLTGLNIPWGAINISVYNQSRPWQEISPFGILISNVDGSQVYQNVTSSPHIIDVFDIPYGYDVIFVVNATGYKDTKITRDISLNRYIKMYVYLAPLETEEDPDGGDPGGSGENYSTTEHYIIQVIDELDDPVPDAKITIRFYNNYTDSWDERESFLTDGYGQGDVWLVPGVLYKVNIEADGYISLVGQNWIPVYIEYSDDRYKIFRLEFEEFDYDNETSYSYCITFNGHVSGSTGYVNYSDICENTVNISFSVFEFNHSTNVSSLFYSYSNSSDNDFTFSFSLNVSNTYTVRLFLNHSDFGFIQDSMILPGHPWGYDKRVLTNKTEFESVFDIFGDNPFGWANIFGIFMLLVGLFAFGQRNIGVSMVLTGMIMAGLQVVIGIAFITFSAWVLLILLGMLVQWHMNRRVERG